MYYFVYDVLSSNVNERFIESNSSLNLEFFELRNLHMMKIDIDSFTINNAVS